MFVNSSDLCATDLNLEEVSARHLDTVTHGDPRTRGAEERKLQVVGNNTFVLSVENDNDFRSRCGLSGTSGLASNPANRQIASSSGASAEHHKKKILNFFYFFSKKTLTI